MLFLNGWQIELQGMINGGGYLCSCSSCDYSRVSRAVLTVSGCWGFCLVVVIND